MPRKNNAHTRQPVRKDHGNHGQPQGVTFVLGWLLLPVCLACLAVYRWRIAKARMGSRTVRYE